MRKRVDIRSTTKDIRQLKRLLADRLVQRKVALAGAEPVLEATQTEVPIGTRSVREYARRTRSGKANRPSRILRVRRGGNLRDAHSITTTDEYLARVGPRVKPGSGAFAIYAPIVHLRNPWLLRALRKSARKSKDRMSRQLMRMINKM